MKLLILKGEVLNGGLKDEVCWNKGLGMVIC